MCTAVILRRPGHDWPLIVAANRDEMTDRPCRGPGRHWDDRPEVVAGLDALAGGTWLGLNDWGVVAGVLNRPGSLGPEEGLRSRGELPLDALDHADAGAAADAMATIEPASYRTFNLFVADATDAFWIASRGSGQIAKARVPGGLSMITAHDLNDAQSPRIRHFRPLFEDAAPPDPGTGDWTAWQALLGSGQRELDDDPDGSMTFLTERGFGTVSSSLIALPRPGLKDAKPVWLFAPGPPDTTLFAPVGGVGG